MSADNALVVPAYLLDDFHQQLQKHAFQPTKNWLLLTTVQQGALVGSFLQWQPHLGIISNIKLAIKSAPACRCLPTRLFSSVCQNQNVLSPVPLPPCPPTCLLRSPGYLLCPPACLHGYKGWKNGGKEDRRAGKKRRRWVVEQRRQVYGRERVVNVLTGGREEVWG